MPEINLIPEVLHQSSDPYHHYYDNLPLTNILERIAIVNAEVDNSSNILRESIGTQGTLANRLRQSINDDGTLKTSAIDSALHSIADHTDDATYVRMLLTERNKLTTCSSDSTSLKLLVDSTTYDDQTVEFVDSDTITWTVPASNKIKADFSFPANAAHQHFYELTPVHVNPGSPNYTNYKTTSLSTAYVAGSLRVYINGIRLNSATSVYVPDGTGPSGTWTLTKFTPNAPAGTFALNRAITSNDVIKIDFDVAY